MSNEMQLLERVDPLELVSEPVAPKIEETQEQPWEMVYSGDLAWDAAKELGYTGLFTTQNDIVAYELILLNDFGFALCQDPGLEELQDLKFIPHRSQPLEDFYPGSQKQQQLGFARVLARLNIFPFIDESVEQYKEKMIQKMARDDCRKLLFNFCKSYRERRISRFFWKDVYLHRYVGPPIPDYIVALALQVKRAYSEVLLGVCELYDLEDTSTYFDPRLFEPLDPFLYAEVGGKRFYLGVWDEPGFFGVRENEV